MPSELMSAVNTYLLSKLPSPKPTSIPEDFYPGDATDSYMCRHDVSPVITIRYLTGSYWATFSFSYYVKSTSPITARQLLEAVQAVLDIGEFIQLFGVTSGRLEAVTRPAPVSQDEAGVIIYTSSYRLVYFQEENA